MHARNTLSTKNQSIHLYIGRTSRKRYFIVGGLHHSIRVPSPLWNKQWSSTTNTLTFFKVQDIPSTSSSHSMIVTHSATVCDDLSWKAFVHGYQLDISRCQPISSIPTVLSPHHLQLLLNILDRSTVCPGHPDERFVTMAKVRKGELCGKDKTVVAKLDNHSSVILNGMQYPCIVRSNNCSILCLGVKCSACVEYRASLRMLYRRWSSRNLSEKSRIDARSHTNFRYLSTPEKTQRLKELQKKRKVCVKTTKRLQDRIAKLIVSNDITVDEGLNSDLTTIMEENTENINKNFPEGSFHRLFWEQQQEALQAKDSRAIRWHPMMIRWCLHLKLLSSAAYDAVRSSGLLVLPSSRTLRDYTHITKHAIGIPAATTKQLVDEFKSRAEAF